MSGINYARVRTAVREGVRFPAYNVGRLKYIDGDAAIEFIHALRDLHTKKQVEKNAVEQA